MNMKKYEIKSASEEEQADSKKLRLDTMSL